MEIPEYSTKHIIKPSLYTEIRLSSILSCVAHYPTGLGASKVIKQ